MTVKAGQKCTAIRRIFVPENKVEDVRKAVSASLAQTTIGNPTNEKVRMGALARAKPAHRSESAGTKAAGFLSNYLRLPG